MNVFSAFNFGKIIKILMPGFFASFGILLFLDSICKIVLSIDFLKLMLSNNAVFMFFCIPIILAVGMTCNTIFFVSISSKYFYSWFVRSYPEITKLKKDLFEAIKIATVKRLDLDDVLKQSLLLYGNAPAFLYKNIELEHFYFIHESYWAYFEYHANMIVASIVFLVGGCFWIYVNKIYYDVSWLCFLVSIIVLLVSWVLYFLLTVKAAKLNYYKFEIKQLSYFASFQAMSVVCDED